MDKTDGLIVRCYFVAVKETPDTQFPNFQIGQGAKGATATLVAHQ